MLLFVCCRPNDPLDILLPALPLTPLGHIWDVMFICRKGNIEKTVSVLQYATLISFVH